MNTILLKELHGIYDRLKHKTIKTLFAEDANRARTYQIKTDRVLFDYSGHFFTDDVLTRLLKLADVSGLKEKMTAMRTGKNINTTENRPALHILLRDACLPFPGRSGMRADVKNLYAKMAAFADGVRGEKRTGATGKPIDTIVNMGIGGSDLGVKMVYQALQFYATKKINVHFISNVDPAESSELLGEINPETTVFIVCSKSFTTTETLHNARAINAFMRNRLGDDYDMSKHFCAITASPEKAGKFGVDSSLIFPMWDWVGGRYSVCATGLAVMVAIGSGRFYEFVDGFSETDHHFFNAPFKENIPVIMALLGIWYNNVLNLQSYAVIAYSSYLKQFSAYLQQLDMESNGKNIHPDGRAVQHQTGPIVWGEPGTDSQHSFFQLLHQGTKTIPCDFIGFVNPLNDTNDMHDVLMSNFFAQLKTLAFGKNADELLSDNEPPECVPFKVIPGNRPAGCLLFNTLTPRALGSLIALYEHKVFVQGVIWDINSFDQWGVEAGKNIATGILAEIKSGKIHSKRSTGELLKHYLSMRGRYDQNKQSV